MSLQVITHSVHLVHILIIFSKLSQVIKHDIAEVNDNMRKGQKGKEMHPSFSSLS